MLRALGIVIASVAGGGGGSTVAAVGPTDMKCVVTATTVGGRANVLLQFQDATTSANIGSAIPIDIPSSYAARVATEFATMRCFGL